MNRANISSSKKMMIFNLQLLLILLKFYTKTIHTYIYSMKIQLTLFFRQEEQNQEVIKVTFIPPT